MIPHELDIHNPDELYAALIVFPVSSCLHEAVSLTKNPSMGQPSLDPIKWDYQWRDTCLILLGDSPMNWLSDSSEQEVWDDPKAYLGITAACDAVSAASRHSFVSHPRDPRGTLECFAWRCCSLLKQIAEAYGYAEHLVANGERECLILSEPHKCGQ